MISKDSPDWPGARAWLQLAIEKAREALENPDCPIKHADHLRGEIIAYRGIIAFVEPSNVIPMRETVPPPGVNY